MKRKEQKRVNEYDRLEERKDKAWGDLGNTLYEMSKDEPEF